MLAEERVRKFEFFFSFFSPPRCCDGFRMLNLSGAGVNID